MKKIANNLVVSILFAIFVIENQTNNNSKTTTNMGKRLHSAVKYEIVYGEQSGFNWLSDLINPIIDTLAENDCSYDTDDIYYASAISANRANLIANLDKIINPDNDWEYQEDLDYNLSRLENNGVTRDELYKQLKAIVEQSDSRCEDVHFAWF